MDESSFDVMVRIWSGPVFEMQLPVELVHDDSDRRVALDYGGRRRQGVDRLVAFGALADEIVAVVPVR